jgi:hypothetical protein
MNTKKLLIYGGGAMIVGAVTYFVWAFFQKTEIPILQTATSSLNNEDEQGSSTSNYFKPEKFDPIITPNILNDISNFHLKL